MRLILLAQDVITISSGISPGIDSALNRLNTTQPDSLLRHSAGASTACLFILIPLTLSDGPAPKNPSAKQPFDSLLRLGHPHCLTATQDHTAATF